MSIELSGFKEFITNQDSYIDKWNKAMDKATYEIGQTIVITASDLSPVDTGTLQESWEINYEATKNEDGNHEKEVFSNPEIIATNPKHPNGNYYSYYIEHGFTKPDGSWYEGKHMLESGITVGKNNMKNIIFDNINEEFGGE